MKTYLLFATVCLVVAVVTRQFSFLSFLSGALVYHCGLLIITDDSEP